jgi:hypothetical protein
MLPELPQEKLNGEIVMQDKAVLDESHNYAVNVFVIPLYL